SAAREAAVLDAVLWIPLDRTVDDGEVTDVLLRSRVPAVLTGPEPWRPASVLAARSFVEVDIPAATHGQRRSSWQAALPGIAAALADTLAGRYRLGGDEIRAVAAVADTGARFAGNGRPAPLADHVPPAAALVSRARSTGYARVVHPRRTV